MEVNYNTCTCIVVGCVCQGDESDPLSNRDLRASVFTLYWKLLVQPALPETLVQIAVWVCLYLL